MTPRACSSECGNENGKASNNTQYGRDAEMEFICLEEQGQEDRGEAGAA